MTRDEALERLTTYKAECEARMHNWHHVAAVVESNRECADALALGIRALEDAARWQKLMVLCEAAPVEAKALGYLIDAARAASEQK